VSDLHLYEIANQYQSLKALEDMSDLPVEVIRDTLEALEGDLQTKSIAVAKFIGNLGVHAQAIQEAANAMTARAKRVQKRADAVKAYLLYNMQACQISKIECAEFTISVCNNPEAVRIGDNAEIPEEFMVTPDPLPPTPDKKAIKAALKAGIEIPGVWLEQGQNLKIET
jgi:hypothetical protein